MSITGLVDVAALAANLTATQERCNELLEDARKARRERDAARMAGELLSIELQSTRELLDKALSELERISGVTKGFS